MNKHVMAGLDGADGGTTQCLGCRQYVYGSLIEVPPGECPTPYKSPTQLLAETATIAMRLVVRELETLANGAAIKRHNDALEELRALLSAPVVERQEPIMHITPQVLGMLKGELRMQSGGITFSESKPIGNWTVPLYTSPPLQADVDAVKADHNRLVRELDVLLNGEAGAAEQASLCDIVAQVRMERAERRETLLRYVRAPSREDPKYHEVWPEIEGGPVFDGVTYCNDLFKALKRYNVVVAEVMPEDAVDE